MIGLYSLISLAIFLPTATYGANDWNQPCFDGVCSWDVNDGSGASGGLTLSGSSNAISDITTAAGWEIMSCQTTANITNVRLVCSSDDTASAGCDHLEQNGGAQNKLVRLPTGCGTAPFGRVADIQVSNNQTIPSSTHRRLHRRSGSAPPQVKELTLDTDWSAIPVSKNGPVQMYIAGANVPGAENIHNTAILSSSSRRRGVARRTMDRRNFFTNAINAVGNAISSTANAEIDGGSEAVSAVASVATQAATAVVSVATEAASVVVSVATEAASAAVAVATAVNTFNDTQNFQATPVNFNQAFTLLNTTIGCNSTGDTSSSAFTASADISGNAAANVTIGVAVVAVGTLVPPNLSDFQAIFSGSANMDGDLSVNVGVEGPLSTSVITLVQPIGLPGLTIPDILVVGPSVELTGQVTGELDLSIAMDVTVSFAADNIQIFFPPQSGQTSAANTSLNNSPLTLSANPSLAGSASAELHLTPTLQLGLNAFSNKVQADVFVDFDAAVQFNATNVNITEGSGFSGDLDIAIPISVNVGANGDFFGLLSGRSQITVFEHTFDVFSKSVGAASTKREFELDGRTPSRYVPLSGTSIMKREEMRLAQRADLFSGYHKRGPYALLAERQNAVTCPSTDPTSNLQQIASTNGTITN